MLRNKDTFWDVSRSEVHIFTESRARKSVADCAKQKVIYKDDGRSKPAENLGRAGESVFSSFAAREREGRWE